MRSNSLILVIAIAGGLLAAGSAAGQSFKGKGPEATKPFPLAEGTVVFEVEHRGEGAFVVNLVNEQGGVVDEVARGAGVFGGSKGVRVPRTGEYHFDVQAPGTWSVRLLATEVTGAETESARQGRAEGTSDADAPGTAGWLGRGFVGGLVGGPIGMGLMLGKVEPASERDAEAAAAAKSSSDLAFAAAYREAFEARLRHRRQRSAMVGGAIGTGVLAFTLIKLIDLGGTGETTEFPGIPTTPAVVVPVTIRF